MTDLLQMMKSDHETIDKLIAGLKDKSKSFSVTLEKLKKNLRRHFDWEEDILFSEFERNTGRLGADIVFVL